MQYLAVSVGQRRDVPFVDITLLKNDQEDATVNKEGNAWIRAHIEKKYSVVCKLFNRCMRITFDVSCVSRMADIGSGMADIVFYALRMYARVHSLCYYPRDWDDESINGGCFRRWNCNVKHVEQRDRDRIIDETLISCMANCAILTLTHGVTASCCNIA